MTTGMDREGRGRRRPARRPRRATSDRDGLPLESSSEWDTAGTARRRRVYLALTAIALTAAIASITLRSNPWVDRFGPNFATEVLGIILTLVFVHRFLEHQDRARRLRASIGALRRGSRALHRFIEAWGALIKGSLRRPAAGPPATLDELLAPYITENVVHMDPFALRPGSDQQSVTWVRWAIDEFRGAQHTLHEIIVTYGASLDPAYVEAVDDLIDDPFISLLTRLADAPADGRAWRIQLNTARALREAHFERLLQTLRLHNRIAAEAATVRTRGSAPRSGSLGVELARDHDLRVERRIEAAWWKRAPVPGTLSLDPTP
jgi:hypothetical protein